MRTLKTIFLFLLLAAASSVVAIAQQTGDVTRADFKQLAGAADEIERMRLPAAASLSLQSKTALLPVAADHARQKFAVPIENAGDFRLMLLAPDGESWTVKIALPGAEFINARSQSETGAVEITKDFYGLGDERFPAEIFHFKTAASGVARVEINTNESKRGGFLAIASDSPLLLDSYVDTFETTRGSRVGFVASLLDAADEAAFAGNITGAAIEIETPGGARRRVPMFDDGSHNDKAAGDGVFGGWFVPSEAGAYTARVVAEGVAANGARFIRTGEHSITAANPVVLGGAATVRAVDDFS